MGLDTTHDAWHGAYSSFKRFRIWLASLIGLDLQNMEGYCEDGIKWDTISYLGSEFIDKDINIFNIKYLEYSKSD